MKKRSPWRFRRPLGPRAWINRLRGPATQDSSKDSNLAGTEAGAKGERDPFDFSDEPNSKNPAEQPVVGREYDSRPHEDTARRTIAYLLIGLLWVIIGAMLLMVSSGAVKVDDLKDFGVILGPIITLVSAATGFYYGTKSNH